MVDLVGLGPLDILDWFEDVVTADKSTAGSTITSGTRMGGAKTPLSSTTRPAIFKRELKISHPTLGVQIKDTPLSSKLTDVYDGQARFFHALESPFDGTSLPVGTIPMGNTHAATDYVLEFPVLDTPSFGSGELIGLELNLYHDQINYNLGHNLPDMEVYKFKRTLSTVGDFGVPRTDKVYVAGSRWTGVPFISEIFDGTDTAITGDIPNSTNTQTHATSREGLYITLDDAWDINEHEADVSRTQASRIEKKSTFRRYYGTYWNGQWIILMVHGKGRKYKPDHGQRWWLTDFSVQREYFDKAYGAAKDSNLLENRFEWQAFKYKNESVETAVTFEDLDTAKITEDTTVFDEIRYTETIRNEEGADKKDFYYATAIPHFSTLNSPSSGQCLALSTYVDSAQLSGSPPAPYTYTFGNASQAYQTSMALMRIPKPQRLSRFHNNSDPTDEENLDCVQIDIKMSIIEMNKYHYSDGASENRTTGPSADERGHGLIRGFFAMFATRKPRTSESFGDYINAMNQTDDTSNNLTDASSDNAYNGVGFIKYSDFAEKPNNSNPTEGEIKIVTSTEAAGIGSTNVMYAWNQHGSSHSRPYVRKGPGSGDAAIDPQYIHTIGTDGFEFTEGNWYTLRAMIYQDGTAAAPDKGCILWQLLDTDNNVLFTHRQLHVGNPPDSGAAYNNRQSGFPSYLSLWVNNCAKPASEDDSVASELMGADGIYDESSRDSTVKVLIDSIIVTGVENEVNNNTVAERNDTRGSISIDSETGMSLTDFEGSHTLGEPPRDFGASSKKAAAPTYISWGFNENIFEQSYQNFGLVGNTNHFFLGGYTTSNPTMNDIDDNTKRILFLGKSDATGAGQHDTDITFYLPEADIALGMWHVEGRYVNLDKSPNINNHVTLSGTMSTDHFTKKGFFTIDNSVMGASDSGTNFDRDKYKKRENPAVATKIIGVSQAKNGRIKVKNNNALKGFIDDTFIIYRAGYAVDFQDTTGNAYYRKDLKIVNTKALGDTISLESVSGGKSAYYAESGAALCKDEYLHELYISPYKYWLMCEIYNVEESDRRTFLPSKGFTHSTVIKEPEPINTTLGMSFSEYTYSDTTAYSYAWKPEFASEGGLTEDTIDFGFGATSDNNQSSDTIDNESGSGYIRKYVPETGYNKVSLDGLVSVEGSRLNKPNEKINLYIKPATEVDGGSAVHTTKSSGKEPYLVFYYADAKPTVENFAVQPAEDPFYPKYTWETSDDDLWYGFLMLSSSNAPTVKVGGAVIVGTSEIKHQYEGAVAHIPLNETIVTDRDKVFLYRYDGNYGGQAESATRVGPTVTSSANTTTIEGLSGNALYFSGVENQLVEFHKDKFTNPTNQFSLVAHFTCDSLHATDNRYIVGQSTVFETYIDTSGNINAKLYPATGTAVELKSSTIVNTDGETPVNLILTFDYSLPTGNVKLFINGKLEDQTGNKTTSGSVSNWPNNQTMKISSIAEYDHRSNLRIGREPSAANMGWTQSTPYHGTIEEIVLYNQAIYPVVPSTGEITIHKAVPELTMGNPQAGISNTARLFVKDYHNIRGTLANEVAATSAVSYRKSGLGLKSVV